VEREILVSADARETRVALLETGAVVEAAIERHSDRSQVGNIYKARVTRVLPGMQSAFLDIGLERDAFIHVTDCLAPEAGGPFIPDAVRSEIPRIESVLQEGEAVLVQIVKEAIAGKGSRVTRGISLPGRYLVLVPLTSHVGISRKIEDEAQRERLRDMVMRLRSGHEGYIVRTAAAEQGEAEMVEDMAYLRGIWQNLRTRAAAVAAPALLHHDLDRPFQLLRDLFGGSVTRVLVEGEEIHRRILDFVADIAPRATHRVERYSDPLPLFEARGVRREIDRALRNKVWLKSGGSIVINQTEALVSVDVNTGKYTGRRNLEDTILKINLEAVREIVRQLRLRDLGGIIVIDFIDMELPESRQTLFGVLQAELQKDRARNYLHQLSDFGLVQITRRRARRSLERTLCRPCPICRGSGRVKAPPTVASEILMELRCALAESPAEELRVRAHPEVVDQIEAEGDDFIGALRGVGGFKVKIDADPSLSLESYEIEAP
jgi:ribonuclease G